MNRDFEQFLIIRDNYENFIIRIKIINNTFNNFNIKFVIPVINYFTSTW